MGEQSRQKTLRILVVDDSALFRQSISAVLATIDDVEVVGTANDGDQALDRMEHLQPDLITLDVEMPVRNGIETLREMRRRGWKIPTVMVSSLTQAGAEVTLESLFLGAFDFISKPTTGLVSGRAELRAALIQKIDALRLRGRSSGNPARHPESTPASTASACSTAAAGLASGSSSTASIPIDSSKADASRSSSSAHRLPPSSSVASPPCDLIVLGLSTGGPAALRQMIPRLDPDLASPIVVVQHMPAAYTGTMARRLDEVSPIQVELADNATVVSAGKVIIAPGGRQTRVIRSTGRYHIRLSDDPPENGCRPSIDYTIRYATEAAGNRLLVGILTGMGKDGLVSSVQAKAAGATIFCQDQETSAVYGMPRAIADAGVADRILPLGKFAAAINRHVRRCGVAS